ncbi:MAG TPA: bifunctional phosphoribosyl-AMP cyclohydrolase/phosphoribosyl-ATP diphosphatase HisIE [Chloroflexota bacterium]|jgi:phosphoribosyl-ATP pyrophosphohydrolase/phosphoribosyl-AMP cyclohydrolase
MLKYDANGLIPAVVQDAETRQVLMVGYMNRESVQRTVETGQAWFWSRSRGELWHKGATSGHYLNVRAIHVDCDGDTLLVEAAPAGPTCHTGAVSCFFNELEAEDGRAAANAPAEPVATAGVAAGAQIGPEENGSAGTAALDGRAVEALFAVIQERQRLRPEGSYVAKLLDAGVDRIAKKIGEEATEVVIAAKNADQAEITWEVADLWFHSLVLLAASGLTPADIWQELDRRRR